MVEDSSVKLGNPDHIWDHSAVIEKCESESCTTQCTNFGVVWLQILYDC